MTSIASQKKMKFTSDYPIEKVMFLTSGSASVPNSTVDLTPGISIPHGLPFTPLPEIVWSNTSDFSIANVRGDSAYNSSAFTTGAGQLYAVSADATNVYITRYNNSGSTQTLYYRITCLAPSDASEESVVNFTANSADKFVFNSDYNYMKLFKAGKLTSGSNTYAHGLGYIPRVRAWYGLSGSYSPDIFAQMIDTDPTGGGGQTSGVHITSTQIIWLNPSTYDDIEYRIYLDE